MPAISIAHGRYKLPPSSHPLLLLLLLLQHQFRTQYTSISHSSPHKQTTAMATRRRCSHLTPTAAVLLLAAVWLSSSSSPAAAQTADTQSKCQGDMAHLTECMDYATGHEPSPSSTCCGDISGTQKARPECLCYIIQQVHGAGQAHGTQQLGLRLDRVLALPSACKLAGANVSLCINLLHLTPSSPDYAMFLNASKITPSTAAPMSDSNAAGSKAPAGLRYRVVAAAVASAVFSSIF